MTTRPKWPTAPRDLFWGAQIKMIRCYKEHIPEGNGAILTDGKVALSDTF